MKIAKNSRLKRNKPQQHGLSCKTKAMMLDLIQSSDDGTLRHLQLVARDNAEDSLSTGDMDRHFRYGQVYHLIAAELERRDP